MNDHEIRIVELPAMRVVSFLGFGSEPEIQAWNKLKAWTETQELLKHRSHHRIFGFNNPNPAAGSPNYGYELWITVDADVEPPDEAQIVEFPGGLYAVRRCNVQDNAYEVIPAAWRELARWCEDSSYEMAHHQWLEEHISMDDMAEGNFMLDLFLPIHG